MTVAHRQSSPRQGKRVPYDPGVILRLNIPVMLAFLAMLTLMLEPLFTSASALAFLIFGAMLMLHRYKISVTALSRYWFLLILPAFCLLSTFWSQYPSTTARYGFQLALSLIIAIVIAARVSPRNLFYILFVSNLILLAICTALGARPDERAWQGVYASKNAYATLVAMVFLLSLAMLYEKKIRLTLKLAAFGLLALCPFLLLKAQSAGVIMGLAPPVVLMVLFHFTRRWKPAQRIGLLIFASYAAMVAGLAIMPHIGEIFSGLLTYFGKDPTLTGRTELWDTAFRHIGDRPILGLGYRAFWVPGNADAEALWQRFGIQSGGGFSFHNLYISNAVEIGILGVAIQSAIIFAAFMAAIIKLTMAPSTERMFFVMFMLFIVYRSFGEVQLFFGFSDVSIIVYAICVYSLKKAEDKSVQATRVRHPRNNLSDRHQGHQPDPEQPA